MKELSEEAKKYLRVVLEYAEYFDGTQEAIAEAFGAPEGPVEMSDDELDEYDKWYADTVAPARNEVYAMLYEGKNND